MLYFPYKLSALISKNAAAHEQGSTLGLSQGLGSLARALGPFCGLMTFAIQPDLPYWIASLISAGLFLACMRVLLRPIADGDPSETPVFLKFFT